MTWPNSSRKSLLSSITSIELRKIIFLVDSMDLSRIFAQGMEKWTSIDKDLCGIVDQLRTMGHCHILEVELRFARVSADDPGKYSFTDLLPEFGEKGIVTIIDTAQQIGRAHV